MLDLDMTEVSHKVLAVSDDTAECVSALVFAGLRANRLRAGLVILRCAHVAGWGGWAGLDKEITQDALDSARVKAQMHADLVEKRTEMSAEIVVSAEEPLDAVREAIDKDRAIRALVLAAGSGRWGPGPLVSRLARGKPLSRRPLAVTVIPGELSEAQIAELGGVAV
jgi:hypothetical protein